MKINPLPKLTPKQAFRLGMKIKPVGDCWEWQGSLAAGYGSVKIGGRTYKSHRVAYYLVTGADLGNKFACHKCDNTKCCRPAHIFAGTNSDNLQDASRKGRLKRTPVLGEKNHAAKLTNEMAREIKYSTERNTILAARYQISAMIVGMIKRGKRWSHI